MAIISCPDAWANNTIRNTAQTSACLDKSALSATHELPEEIFLAVVLDALNRLAVDGVAGFQPLANYEMCDAETNANKAQCKFMPVSLPIETDATEQKQQILWLLGAALCTNGA